MKSSSKQFEHTEAAAPVHRTNHVGLAEALRPRRCGGIISDMSSRTVRTMCPMNCHPTYCGMLVEIGEDGRVRGIHGDPDNPDSRGFLCVRGRAAIEIPYNERRLRMPLRRAGGRRPPPWAEIGWPAPPR